MICLIAHRLRHRINEQAAPNHHPVLSLLMPIQYHIYLTKTTPPYSHVPKCSSDQVSRPVAQRRPDTVCYPTHSVYLPALKPSEISNQHVCENPNHRPKTIQIATFCPIICSSLNPKHRLYGGDWERPFVLEFGPSMLGMGFRLAFALLILGAPW